MLLMKVMKRADVKVMTDVVRIIDHHTLISSDVLSFESEEIYSFAYRALLYQSGYLTIKEEDEDNRNLVYLDFPNIEVAKAYLVRISDFCTQKEAEEPFKESWLYEYMLRHIRALHS